jgi:sodium/bile acid cotransporter 7
MIFLEHIKRYWFLICLLLILLLAYLKPSFGKTAGPLRPEYTIKYCSAFLIFFLTGFSIKNQASLFFKIFFFL